MMGLPTMRCEGFTKMHQRGTKELIHIFHMNITNKLINNDDLFRLTSDLFKNLERIWDIFFSGEFINFLLRRKQFSRNGIVVYQITIFKMGFQRKIGYYHLWPSFKYTYI